MRRVEIIGNHSLEQDLLDALAESLPDQHWTKIPDVHGRGAAGWKLGDGVWPETNFLLFCYCAEEAEKTLRGIVENIRNRHPSEGIGIFSTEAGA